MFVKRAFKIGLHVHLIANRHEVDCWCIYNLNTPWQRYFLKPINGIKNK
ncbi:MAG: hypothetical protein ACI9JT_000605 [Polaribacter sp.]|jgi:hypothetical protein